MPLKQHIVPQEKPTDIQPILAQALLANLTLTKLKEMPSRQMVEKNIRVVFLCSKNNDDDKTFIALAVDENNAESWAYITGPKIARIILDDPEMAYRISDFKWNREDRLITIEQSSNVSSLNNCLK